MAANDFIDLNYLQDVWRPMNADEQVRGASIIHQVSSYLRLIARNNGIDIDEKISKDTTLIYQDNVKMVVANAVVRAMSKPADVPPDATSWSQSASPYSETMMFTGNATQNAYFKRNELRLLGIWSVSGKANVSLLRGARGEAK